MMKGQVSYLWVLAAVAVVLVATGIVSFAGLSAGGILNTGTPVGSMTVKSISLTNFDSNDAGLAGQAWLVSATAGGAGGDYLVGNVAHDSSLFSSTAKSKYDFSLEAKTTDSVCSYTAVPTQTNLYYIALKWKSCVNPFDSTCGAHYLVVGDAKTNCMSQGGSYFLDDGFGTYYCYAYNKVGFVSAYDQQPVGLKYNIAVAVDSNGAAGQAKLSDTITSAKLDNNLGLVKWAGNNLDNRLCPSGSGVLLATRSSDGYRSLADPTYLARLGNPNHENTQVSNCIGGTPVYLGGFIYIAPNDITKAMNCMNLQNSAVDQLFLNDRYTVSSDSIFKTSRLSSTVIDVPVKVVIPDLVFKINALWLGVYQPVGKPAWVSVSNNPSYSSGSVYPLKGTLMNNGTVGATFSYWAECTGLSVLDGSKQVALQAGQQSEVSVSVQGTNSGSSPASFSCVLKAQDPNTAVIAISQTISGTVGPQFVLDCKAPFIADNANRRCACGLTSCDSGKKLDLTTCTCSIIPQSCGNGVCDGGETRGTCPQDCGPANCVDGTTLNLCSTVNKGMYCSSSAQLIAADSCKDPTCPVGTTLDPADGTCKTPNPDYTMYYIVGGLAVLAVISLVAIRKKGKR